MSICTEINRRIASRERPRRLVISRGAHRDGVTATLCNFAVVAGVNINAGDADAVVDGAVLARCGGYSDDGSSCCKPSANMCTSNNKYQSMNMGSTCGGGNAAVEGFQNRQNQYANLAYQSNSFKRCGGF